MDCQTTWPSGASTQVLFSHLKKPNVSCLKKKRSSKPKLFLENKSLPFVNNITILGLIFDSKLTWKLHIVKTKTSTTKSINILKTLSLVECGAESNALINLNIYLIRSKLNYGSIRRSICYTNSNPNILKKTIYIIRSSGLRVVTGAF